MIVLFYIAAFLVCWIILGCISTMISLRIIDFMDGTKYDPNSNDNNICEPGKEYQLLLMTLMWPIWLLFIVIGCIGELCDSNKRNIGKYIMQFFSILRKKK